MFRYRFGRQAVVGAKSAPARHLRQLVADDPSHHGRHFVVLIVIVGGIEGCPLGTWVGNQRAFHRRGELPRRRAQRLEALPGWAWHPHDAAWEDGFTPLQAFAEREGHSCVPFADRDTTDSGWDGGFRTSGLPGVAVS